MVGGAAPGLLVTSDETVEKFMSWADRVAGWLRREKGKTQQATALDEVVEESAPLVAAPNTAPAKPTASPTPAELDDGDNESVRVFVSSTFLDMKAERDVLVDQVFPALRAKYRARGVEVFEVDLRWGITGDQQERGETLPTLLAEIDRCRPYFIGLIGDRFGWVPPPAALNDKLMANYPAVANARGMSVTAMEIIHAVSDPDTAAQAFFFERDLSWDWISTLSEVDRAALTAEPDLARTKLAELKTLIRQKTRVETYARPEDIRQKVTDSLDAMLEARFPQQKAPDAFEQTTRLHSAYARERRGLHIGADAYLRKLDSWAELKHTSPILITGASGGGKSTLSPIGCVPGAKPIATTSCLSTISVPRPIAPIRCCSCAGCGNT